MQKGIYTVAKVYILDTAPFGSTKRTLSAVSVYSISLDKVSWNELAILKTNIYIETTIS